MTLQSKILVTGGAGFIGSNLCEELIRLGANVVCLDNFSTGKMENIEQLLSHPHFKLITGDIRSIDDCRRAAEGCDYVLHEAALGSVPRSINDPITTNEVNIGGFLNILFMRPVLLPMAIQKLYPKWKIRLESLFRLMPLPNM